MKNKALFPILLMVCSVASAAIYRNPFTYINLLVSVIILCIVMFARKNPMRNRFALSALWLLVLELFAFLLLLLGISFYHTPYAWLMYVVFVALEVFVTPRIDTER